VAVVLAALVAFFDGAFADGTSDEMLSVGTHTKITKDSIRLALVTLQQQHPHALIPRRLMKELNGFFVTEGGGWDKFVSDVMQL
jgi:phage tail tape-measure protein